MCETILDQLHQSLVAVKVPTRVVLHRMSSRHDDDLLNDFPRRGVSACVFARVWIRLVHWYEQTQLGYKARASLLPGVSDVEKLFILESSLPCPLHTHTHTHTTHSLHFYGLSRSL
jgi:hypothetical protein